MVRTPSSSARRHWARTPQRQAWLVLAVVGALIWNERRTRTRLRQFDRNTTATTTEEKATTTTPPPNRTLFLIGERHSGTKTMYKHLQDCFAGSIAVEQRYANWKHWFQREEYVRHRAPQSSVVVAMFRNPYAWTRGMHQVPWHTKHHYGLRSWRDFVTTPWTMPRTGRDVAFAGASAASATRDITCAQNNKTKPHELIPCLEERQFRGLRILYELAYNGSGLPYQSVLELRRDKIVNFLSIKHFRDVQAFYPVRFEDVFENTNNNDEPPYDAHLLRQLERDLGVSAQCQPLTPRPKPLLHVPFDSEFVQYLNEHVDWETEALLGYQPILSPQPQQAAAKEKE